ncbi:MAG TPA: 4-alpha-glucanotransferase, partial [Mycobacteriales bacterium]|nr:4-alpha-glucanotransferase [Mycobacteriales bacterium]
MTSDDSLDKLAAAHGVLTHYDNWAHQRVDVLTRTVVATLAALDVDATSHTAIREALRDAYLAPWRRTISPTVVVRPGRPAFDVNARDRAPVRVRVELEDGGDRELAVGPASATRDVDGTTIA